MEITPEIKHKLELLNEKYAALGQDLLSYLDGLLYADTVKYWDYIELDTLLSLQKPRTSFPDEMIFIGYHQITELYFKLALHEFDQIANNESLTKEFFISRVNRINRYFESLTQSFDIMVDGMDPGQFQKFRMSLLPASGFQSAQYRKIEIASTDFLNLIKSEQRSNFSFDSTFTDMVDHIYWKSGATELSSGKKTLTLEQFEKKYIEELGDMVSEYKHKNLWQRYKSLPLEDQQDPQVIACLKNNDINVNINWPLCHYKSAVRYLNKDSADIAATGGTNWQKYLPPRFQKRVFYPELWNETEYNDWGKSWVENVIG